MNEVKFTDVLVLVVVRDAQDTLTVAFVCMSDPLGLDSVPPSILIERLSVGLPVLCSAN